MGEIYVDYVANADKRHTISIEKAHKIINSEQTKHCENLEDELNRLWVARCKANDAFVDFIALLQEKGYTFKFSELPTKQLELVEISKKQRSKR